MFNYASLQEIVPMLLYWAMGLYVLTRSPRSTLSLVAAATQFSVGVYLFHVAVHRNIYDLEEFRAWGGRLWWAGAAAPLLWYWTSVVVLHRERPVIPRWYRRMVAYPLGGLLSLAAVGFGALAATTDQLLRWSRPDAQPGPPWHPTWSASAGPLFPWFGVFMVICMVVPLVHLAWVWRRVPRDSTARSQVRWLTVSALIFVGAGNWLALNVLLGGLPRVFGLLQPGYFFLTGGLAVLAWTAVRHGTWIEERPVRDDFLYFLAGQGIVVGIYAGVFVLIAQAGLAISLVSLVLLFTLCLLALTTHALADIGRITLGRLFFPQSWQTLALFLHYAAQTGRMRDPAVLWRIVADRLDRQWWYSRTEEALRALGDPQRLARLDIIPRLISDGAIPLDQARGLAELIVASIEKLKPADGRPPPRLYLILKEHYVEARATKAIMVQHQIPEKTYYNERRKGVAAIAEELRAQAQALRHRQQAQHDLVPPQLM